MSEKERERVCVRVCGIVCVNEERVGVYFSGNTEANRYDAVVGHFEKTNDFARHHITRWFGNETNPAMLHLFDQNIINTPVIFEEIINKECVRVCMCVKNTRSEW
jgi:hypothetical protein